MEMTMYYCMIHFARRQRLLLRLTDMYDVKAGGFDTM